MARLIHQKTRQVLAEEVITVRNFFLRLKGLMGCKDLPVSQAFWLLPCKGGIHTFFMRFPIDVIFVDKSLQVTSVYKNIKPWKAIETFASMFSNTYSVFEFKTGALSNCILEKGDQLYVGH